MFWNASSAVFTWTSPSRTNRSGLWPGSPSQRSTPSSWTVISMAALNFSANCSARKIRNTVPLVIMGAPRCKPSLDETGALFAFEKPISVEQAVRTLSAARSMILDGRLRYHRAGLEVPVSVNCKGQKPLDAFLVNLSQGGMQIHINDPVEAAKALQVTFELPGAVQD